MFKGTWRRLHIKVRRFQKKVRHWGLYMFQIKILYLDVKLPGIFEVADRGSRWCIRFYVPHFWRREFHVWSSLITGKCWTSAAVVGFSHVFFCGWRYWTLDTLLGRRLQCLEHLVHRRCRGRGGHQDMGRQDGKIKRILKIHESMRINWVWMSWVQINLSVSLKDLKNVSMSKGCIRMVLFRLIVVVPGQLLCSWTPTWPWKSDISWSCGMVQWSSCALDIPGGWQGQPVCKVQGRTEI